VAVPRAARAAVLGQRGGRLPRRGHPGPGVLPVGVDGDRAGLPVDQHDRTLGHVVEAADRHDAGQAQLAGDDRGVAGGPAQPGGQGDDPRGVQPGRVGRGQVVGQQHRRGRRHRDAGLPLPGELGDDPVPDVADVGGPLGHHPAQAGEQVDELSGSRHRGHGRGGALADPLLHRGEQSSVAGELCGGGEHLGADAGGGRGAPGQALGHRLRGRTEALLLGRALGLVDPRALGRRQLHGADRADHGSHGDAGDHRGAGEHDRPGEVRRVEPGAGRSGGHQGLTVSSGPAGVRPVTDARPHGDMGGGTGTGATTMVLPVTRVTKWS
jgi:hypothetical protein